MKRDGAATSTTSAWAAQRELSALPALRAMRAVALFAGRRVTRALLVPIALYFVVAGRATRRHSRAYLARALGRPAGWRDVYRHVHTFASTVLDRVYLLQERFDAFDFDSLGTEAILDPFARGEGVLAFGAHLGSFEALRAIGRDKGLRIAMIMYEENARLINQTLAAIAPQVSLHTIPLGRPQAMLALRAWLDGGGVAGLLADRSLPGRSDRSRTLALSFLGKPALFSDGPFRMAAMLRRKVVFMAGLYRGGAHYDLRFFDLADFSAVGAGGRDAAIRAALAAYVRALETLCREAPYNWFNFYDFWADGDGDVAEERAAA